MGKFSPNSDELDILRDMFFEGAMAHGQECSITLYTTYTDGVLSDPVTHETGVFFEENPSVRTLKNLNWYSEDEEILPSVLYVPVEIEGVPVEIREGSKLTIKIGNSFEKDYEISSVRAPYSHLIWYTCKLVPWFEKEVRNEEDTTTDRTNMDGKYSFFDVDKNN